VIYVHPDPHCPNKIEVEFSEENEVRVLRVYYKAGGRQNSFFGKIIDFYRFYRAHQKAFHSIREFSPELVHAHILTRMGLISWRISHQLKVPLVISEHWSRYFPENNTYKGFFRKMLTEFVVKRASSVVAVSEPLRIAMQQCGLTNRNFSVIPNVVDTSILVSSTTRGDAGMKTIVHVSCFEDKSKNISGFLRSLKALSLLRQDFTCLMVGTGPDWVDMKEYAGFLRIPDSVVSFTGVKTGSEFAGILAGADCSVLSSVYETFGTVVIESLSCGVPVVATKAGIAREVINNTNGLLVTPGDEKAMTDALFQMLNLCREYDQTIIKNSISDTFSKETVGKQIATLYREKLGKF
jgi:glycosyltransferase involved in cell wall biosynthesis